VYGNWFSGLPLFGLSCTPDDWFVACRFPATAPHIPARLRRGAGFLSFSAVGGRTGTGSGQLFAGRF
jgi:hypothetical protein